MHVSFPSFSSTKVLTLLLVVTSQLFSDRALSYLRSNSMNHYCLYYARQRFFLLKFSQNVRLAKQKDLIVAQLDLGSTVFRQENLGTGCQRDLVQVSRHVRLSPC